VRFKYAVLPICILLLSEAQAQEILLQPVTSGLAGPTDIQFPDDGSGRMFVVQQSGLIRIFPNGALRDQPFLDIRSKTAAGGERGLLGLAFPPNYAAKQRFYVNYTDLNGDTVISTFRVSSDPNVTDSSSETILLTQKQPFPNHNGGGLAFGPDGFLYAGLGDGGSGGDPLGNGQNLGTLLGKMLRVDVESTPGTLRIPPSNPFVSRSGARGEIWAYGLRNPWRFSFDRQTGDLWIADVGQDSYEEIDRQPASSAGGENYGWNITEGLHCYQAQTCATAGLTPPIFEYPHTLGCSITGGFVYRGTKSPRLRGDYVYGDYCSGRIWALSDNAGVWTSRVLLESGRSITVFGQDRSGEIYLGDAAGAGSIWRIAGSTAPEVVNAASFLPGLTPGSLATAFVTGIVATPGITFATQPLPQSIGGVSVTVNNVPAPVVAIANVNGVEQVNFQAPFESPISGNATITVSGAGATTAANDIAAFAFQPAIYSNATVHNATYTLVTSSSPLTRGEYAFLYASGLGRVNNQPPNGQTNSGLAATLNTVEVLLNGAPIEVEYAGLAPGLPGVYQVNFRIPQSAQSGQQPLRLRMGSTLSSEVSVPIQ